MRYIVIPARRNSKGYPFKNRRLFPLTACTIPNTETRNTIVSTDDEKITSMALDAGFLIHERTEDVSRDTTCTTDLLKQLALDYNMSPEDDIVMLYLTYPERTFEDVELIYKFYKKEKGVSLLCSQEAITHPYMCYYNLPENKGMRVIDHDLYRRQDYPSCFFVSYFIAIIKVEYLALVNKNLVHSQTLFYPLPYNSIDIDTEQQLTNLLQD